MRFFKSDHGDLINTWPPLGCRCLMGSDSNIMVELSGNGISRFCCHSSVSLEQVKVLVCLANKAAKCIIFERNKSLRDPFEQRIGIKKILFSMELFF
jgi:hypothetical protein